MKFAFLFLCLIGTSFGADNYEEMKLYPLPERPHHYQSTDEDVPLAGPIIEDQQDQKGWRPIHRAVPVIHVASLVGLVVGGYFLCKYVYDSVEAQYSPPRFSPVSGGSGSSCWTQVDAPNPCICYSNSFIYQPPLAYEKLPNILSAIQKSCSLPEATLQKIGNHLNASWHELNGGAPLNYLNAQCQNESFIRDYVQVSKYPPGLGWTIEHTVLSIMVNTYAAPCLARTDPRFFFTIFGWTAASIFIFCCQLMLTCDSTSS